MLDVTEKAVGNGLGQVAEPDIAERGVVCETLDSKEEGIDNAESKSLVPFPICQNVLSAGRGDEVCLYDKLFPVKTLCICTHREKGLR